MSGVCMIVINDQKEGTIALSMHRTFTVFAWMIILE